MATDAYQESFGPSRALREFYGTAVPSAATDGYFNVGDRMINTAPTGSGVYMWVCTAAGTGATSTWKTISLAA